MKFSARLAALATASLMALSVGAYADEDFAAYGTAKVDMHEYPEVDQVYDVNYSDPKDLSILYGFVKNTSKVVPGKVVIVTHGPELRAFAKEHYDKYYGLMDQMAELAEQGVEFRMCNNALLAAGYQPEDMHGFVTVVPAGFAEIVMLQSQGYEYINPIPLAVGGIRELEISSE